MATTTRLCSDEELQKARDDLREVIARRRALDALKDPNHFEEGSREEMRQKPQEEEDKVEKKKKMCVMSKEMVETILSRPCRALHGNEAIHKAAQEDEDSYGDLRTLVTVAGVLTKRYQDIIRSAQEKLRHEIETKGYYAYEVTDDEVEDGDENSTASRQGPRGKGRRRHRPGIMKHARGIKKLN